MPKKGKGKGKTRKDIDWAADANFDKNRAMIYIEHSYECPIFQMKADEFQKYVQAVIPERMIQLVRNQNGKLLPRPGAFEINFSQTARTSKHELWSGIDKGPPRRDKFPQFDALIPEIRKVLKKFYAEFVKEEEDDDDMPPGAPMMDADNTGA